MQIPDELTPGLQVPERGRRAQILGSALGIFLRFGFRKTSMDDVARALDLSRQALYAHFRNKDDLFRAALEHALSCARADGAARLRDASLPLGERIAQAYDENMGRYIGLGADLADLHEATARLGGDLMETTKEDFRSLVASTIAQVGLPRAYVERNISERDLALTIDTLAHGVKHSVSDRAEFNRRLRERLDVLLVPFGGSPV